MRNWGRYKYVQRHWKHQWTPLSHQRTDQRAMPQRCASTQHCSFARIGDVSGSHHSHAEVPTQRRDGFRGRDCVS